jgi:3-oxoacyl-[acyl-carrier protein] reductase
MRFAAEGADIALTNIIDNEEFADAVKEIKFLGVKARGYVSDASIYADAEEVIDQIVKDFGTVDILVNNAGITRDTLLMRMTEDQWDQVITVNLKSVFNLTKAVIKPMMKQRSGSIINMSSVVGVSGNAGQANYSASKAGILGLTKSTAKELGSRNIRCNAIAPGFILTEMTSKLADDVKSDWISKIPLRRGGLPEDVANVALFLASELSSYVTGQTIHVCGGMLM